MSKLKPSKKKVNFLEAPDFLEKANPLNALHSVVVNRHAEVIFTFDETEAKDILHKFFDSDIDDKDRYFEIAPGLPKKLVNGSARVIRRVDLPQKIALGLKIREFMATRNEDLGLEIIKEHPMIIFDDGVEISLAVFLSKFSKGAKNIIDIKKEFDWIDLQVESGCSFDNPLRTLVFWWRSRAVDGTPKQKAKARAYLEELVAVERRFLIPTSKGPIKKELSLEKDASIKPFASSWLFNIKRRKSINERIINIYQPVLKDIQEVFKKGGKLNRYKSLMQYFNDKQQLIKKIRSFLEKNPSKQSSDFFRFGNRDASYETVKGKVVDELLKQRKPSDIAWCITGAILGASPRTLKKHLLTSDWLNRLPSLLKSAIIQP